MTPLSKLPGAWVTGKHEPGSAGLPINCRPWRRRRSTRSGQRNKPCPVLFWM